METIVEIFILEEHPEISSYFFKPFITFQQFQVWFFFFYVLVFSVCAAFTHKHLEK